MTEPKAPPTPRNPAPAPPWPNPLRALLPTSDASLLHHAAFYTGVCVLVAVGIVEAPIAIAVGISHALLTSKNAAARGFGEGLGS